MEMVSAGVAGPTAVSELIAAAMTATGAQSGTFIEYVGSGGRVVAACGDLAWAQGRPIEPDLMAEVRRVQSWAGPVRMWSSSLSTLLEAQDITVVTGYPVSSSKQIIGAVHLYFSTADEELWSGSVRVVRAVAGAAAHVYGDRGGSPPMGKSDEDDRALFLAVAGHQLRTPVTVLRGYAGMLADHWASLDDTHRRDAARVLLHRSRELAQLVDRMLSVSVGDSAAGWPVRTMSFDLLDALVRATGELPADLHDAVRLEFPCTLPAAAGDPTLLASIVAELVTNAIRYSPGDSPVVELRAGADAHTVFVRVCDRGIGIDPRHAERCFERFWRGDSDSAPNGVGLGLYLVRRLVERQNGWVSLRPRDGGGTVVEVRLPRADGPLRRPERVEVKA